MINFSIPVTGSSGHLGGGLILTILLGPHAAFLTIASVLVVQALFFADGGLLALGCNIFNLGFFPAFIAYPLVYRSIAGSRTGGVRVIIASILAAAVGLQLGAFSVVLETVASGASSLPFGTFVSLMQPIHLAIGVVEGIVTALVVSFICKARPDILAGQQPAGAVSVRPVAIAFLAAAALIGGVLSWFASEHPDGLEWSIQKITGKGEVEGSKGSIHDLLAVVQGKTAFLPDYSFRKADVVKAHTETPAEPTGRRPGPGESGRDGIRLDTSVSGFVGGLLSLTLALGIGWAVRIRKVAQARDSHEHEHCHTHHHHHEHPHRHGNGAFHSHPHGHEHSHPHPHRHDHKRPHHDNPNPDHAHAEQSECHEHRHEGHEVEPHEHNH
jgi:cobalt/nickel transport system permease protein